MKMNKDQLSPVVFLDSGVGGLPYLFAFGERNPGVSQVYVADTENFPYGTKNERDLLEILERLVTRIVDCYAPKILVIACNTASVVGLAYLRSKFSQIEFVGTVPAIKPAARGSLTRAIGILATTRTLKDPYIFQLHQEFGADCTLYPQAIDDLVKLVEDGVSLDPQGSIEVSAVVAPAQKIFLEAGVDQVVLGCTHFLHVTDLLQSIFGTGVTLVDSREGVAKRVEALLRSQNSSILDPEEGSKTPKLVVTGSSTMSPVYTNLIRKGRLLQEEWGVE